MNKIFTIAKREFKESVFKKSFIIMTLITPFLMILMAVGPSLLLQMDKEESTILNVYDASSSIENELAMTLNDTTDLTPKFVLNFLNNIADENALLIEQKEMINNELIDGYLYIPKDVNEKGEIIYYSKNTGDFDLNKSIRKGVSSIAINNRLKNSGLDHQLINKLIENVPLKTIKITKEGSEAESNFLTEFFSTFIFILILYMTLIMYGMVLMRSIIEEKTSRIIEVLLSATTPFQIMAGKIIGQGSVGLTQYLIWAISGTAIFMFGPGVFSISTDSLNFSPEILFYFVLFYLLGYFLYASMYTGVGALTNSDQESQQMAMPITLMLVVPIMVISLLTKDPDNSIIHILSYIPFFSPMIMFARINLSEPSLIEIWSSIGILIFTILIVTWINAKIFRIGILMYGKRPTLPEILKWFKQ